MSESYLLGDQDPELARLGKQHDLWADSSRRLWKQAGFGAGMQIADLGSGPGFAAGELADLTAPGGSVLAIDSSAPALARLHGRLPQPAVPITTECADLNLWETTANSLDGVFARWTFCFLNDPQHLMKAIARALRPGGALAVIDYFNYDAFCFHPPSAAQEAAREAVKKSWRRSGGDLEIAGKIVRFGIEAGLDLEWMECDQRIARPGEPIWDWPTSFFRSFTPNLIQEGLLDPATAEQLFFDWDERERTPGAFIHLPPMYCLVFRLNEPTLP